MSLSVAIAFSGQMRTFAENARSLVAMFKDAAGPRAEVCFFGALHEADHEWIGKVAWSRCAVLAYEPPPERWREIRLKYPAKAGDIVRAAWEQWQGLVAVGNLVRDFERIRGQRFDWVVRCRPDLAVMQPMEALDELDRRACYFPRHNNWNGLNDRFAFGPSLLMEQYFAYPRHAARFFLPSRTRPLLGCEHMLRWHLENECVPIARTRAVLQPNRGNGVIDPPVYRADRGDLFLEGES